MAREKNNETKRVKTAELKKKGKTTNKNKKTKFKDKHPKASKAIKIGLLVLVLLLIIGAGVLVGAFYGIVGDELKISRESLVVGYENSTVYDKDGNLIATLSGGTKRKSISLSEMSEYLPKAYVAIEDERFYEHSGIDIWRTAYATVTYILNGGKSKFGGSTITQQVIKNITQEKDNKALAGVMRKVKEISKAIQVEQYLSKDQILELYLNLIFTAGNDINGVELGSIYYFNKSAKDLSIAECAYMAGINNSPNAYKPFKDYTDEENGEQKKKEMTEKINKRTKTVLAKMKELTYITEDQYKEAIAEVDNGLKFQNGESASVTVDVSYHTAAAIEQILDQMMAAEEDLSRDMAEMKLYSSGYKIYTTQDTAIQAVLEQEISDDKYFTQTAKIKKDGTIPENRQTSIPTMVIEDHTTGQIVACATAQGEKGERTTNTKLGFLNYPTELKKQTGSSMKPLSVIAPGLITGTITGATTYIDAQTTWGTGANAYTPKNYDNYSNSIMNMRTAIKLSKNVPHVKALSNIGLEAALDFCESVGFPRFENEGLSLALGGLSEGVSMVQMAGAYSAIANGGLYISPTFYTKVVDTEGNTVYEPKQTENRVMSEQLAYIEKSILTEPVYASGGTATYCAMPGIQTAAKTGTTNGDYDRWLCGFTPYYTASCWYGYNKNSPVSYPPGGNPAGKIWSAVMKSIHKELENKQFEEPEGILRATVCAVSGKLATEGCGAGVYSEVFTADNIPTEKCEGHTATSVCVDSGLLATPGCPNQISAYIPEKERNAAWSTQNVMSNIPTEYCPLHGGMGGGPSYVTAEDQVKFQAATDAAAMGLMGVDADAYIEKKLEEWRNSQGMQKGEVQPQHTHNYTTTSQTAATCTTNGKVTKTCSCGDVKIETLPAKGHTFNGGPTCTVCGAKNPNYKAPESGGVNQKPGNVVPPTNTTTPGGGSTENTVPPTNTTSEGSTENPNAGV